MAISDFTATRVAIVFAVGVLGAGTAGLVACGEDEQETTTVTERATTPTTGDTTTGEATTTEAEDVSGNCDEAEHADDPECSGGIEAEDDNSGPGSSGSGGSGSG
ncbi:MAG: hypothetical protein K0R88_702 [Solirubrobacterales bacterium]|jgi:hypothetical protein|nr:hypothetical protein [Solirubrobacterales bacterium]